MEYIVLDQRKNAIGVLDIFESLLWVERFNEEGEFEIYTSVNLNVLEILKSNFYITAPFTDRSMIIESLRIENNYEDGDKLIVTGKSLESILKRRIIWEPIILSGNVQNAIKKVFDDNITNCKDTKRNISDFIFEVSDDANITKLEMEETQYFGNSIYEVISTICKSFAIGFKVYFDDNRQFVFKLYSGTDRSYNQILNPHVIFSNKFDNLISTNYSNSSENYKNTILVTSTEGDTIHRSEIGEQSGLDRREVFIEADDITSDTENFTTLLYTRGLEELLNYREETYFEGSVNPVSIFEYKKDYFMGDLVEIVDNYGHEETVRITEYTISETQEGINSYPTLSVSDI